MCCLKLKSIVQWGLDEQDEQGIDHPVTYFSYKLESYQLKYCTVEKEPLYKKPLACRPAL